MSEFLSRLDFAWPWAWLLIFLPLLGHYFLPQDREVKEHVRVPFLPELIDELKLNSQPVRISKLSSLIFWLTWILLVAALSRPEYLTPPQHIQKPMRDVVLILDVSGSMGKNDVQGGITRLQAVQESVRKFVAARKTDRIGLVIFASQAWPFAPVSEDKQALQTRINQLAPGMIGQQTVIGDALGIGVKLLDTTTNKDASKLAILLTDGNDTASQLAPPLSWRERTTFRYTPSLLAI
jgi:Ca-activated chloride channel family protein